MNTGQQQPSIYGQRANVPSIGRSVRHGLGTQTHPRISIRGNQFLLLDAEGTEWAPPPFIHPVKKVPMLLAVILGGNQNKSKVYYPDPWGGVGEGVPPLCFSDNGFGPSINAQEPQADSCATCKWSKWGSATSRITNKGIPACSDKKKVALMVIGDETGHTFELQIPPASLGAFATYVDKVLAMQLPGGQRETDLYDVVTAINFSVGETGILEFSDLCWTESVRVDPNGAPQLCYDNSGFIAAEDGGWGLVQRVEEIWGSGVIDVLCGLRDRPWTPTGNIAALPGREGMPAPYYEQGQIPAATPGLPPPSPHQVPVQGHPSGAYSPPPGVRPSEPVQAFAQQPQQHPTMPQQAPPQQVPQQPQQPKSSPGHGGARSGAGRKPRGQQAPQAQLAPPFQQPQQAPPLPGGGTSNVVRHPSAPHGVAPAQQEEGIPPFLSRAEANHGNPAPATQGGNGNFGMSQASAPPPGIDNVLSKAFGLKTES